MRIVVVGGQARKVGKTSVMTALIRGLPSLDWTAVKVSRHKTHVPHMHDAAARRGSSRLGFILTEERQGSTTTDTGRFLAAGARRSLWLRVRAGSLNKAVQALLRAVEGERNVMIESSSVAEYLGPTVCLFVLDNSRRSFKADARRSLAQADAIVQVEAGAEHPSLPSSIPPGVPVFSVQGSHFVNPGLCRFVRQKLQSASHFRPRSSPPSRRAGIAERS